jgi:predicted XRE-type DNA-binding protein
MSKDKKVTASRGNVFADLGFENPEEELIKAKLVRELRGILKRRKLTQTQAAAKLGLKQPDVSALVTGRSSGPMPGSAGLQGRPRREPQAASCCFAGDCCVGPDSAWHCSPCRSIAVAEGISSKRDAKDCDRQPGAHHNGAAGEGGHMMPSM